MPITVRIPTPLQRLTNGQGEVSCEVKTVTELLGDLERREQNLKAAREVIFSKPQTIFAIR